MNAGDICCVVPLHNKAATIQRALQSIFAQTAPIGEILVVNDASTDGGEAYVAALEGPRVRLLHRERPGSGGYAARNLAIHATACRWVAFLDADDFWAPSHLQELQAALARHPRAIGAFAARTDRWRKGDRPSPTAPWLWRSPYLDLDLNTFLRGWLAVQDCPVWTSAAMFRRETLIEAGLFPEDARRGGDKDLWLRAASLGPLVFSGARTATFDRTAPNKVTHTAGTAALPRVLATIAQLLDTAADAEQQSLLRRLANQEVRLYARHCFRREPIPAIFRDALYQPEGWRDWLLISGLQVSQPVLATAWRSLPQSGRTALRQALDR